MAAEQHVVPVRAQDAVQAGVLQCVRTAIESRVGPEISKDELLRFLNEQLTAEQRDRLESLPRERMRFELQRLYWQHRVGIDSPPKQDRPPSGKRDTLDQ